MPLTTIGQVFSGVAQGVESGVRLRQRQQQLELAERRQAMQETSTLMDIVGQQRERRQQQTMQELLSGADGKEERRQQQDQVQNRAQGIDAAQLLSELAAMPKQVRQPQLEQLDRQLQEQTGRGLAPNVKEALAKAGQEDLEALVSEAQREMAQDPSVGLREILATVQDPEQGMRALGRLSQGARARAAGPPVQFRQEPGGGEALVREAQPQARVDEAQTQVGRAAEADEAIGNVRGGRREGHERTIAQLDGRIQSIRQRQQRATQVLPPDKANQVQQMLDREVSRLEERRDRLSAEDLSSRMPSVDAPIHEQHRELTALRERAIGRGNFELARIVDSQLGRVARQMEFGSDDFQMTSRELFGRMARTPEEIALARQVMEDRKAARGERRIAAEETARALDTPVDPRAASFVNREIPDDLPTGVTHRQLGERGMTLPDDQQRRRLQELKSGTETTISRVNQVEGLLRRSGDTQDELLGVTGALSRLVGRFTAQTRALSNAFGVEWAADKAEDVEEWLPMAQEIAPESAALQSTIVNLAFARARLLAGRDGRITTFMVQSAIREIGDNTGSARQMLRVMDDLRWRADAAYRSEFKNVVGKAPRTAMNVDDTQLRRFLNMDDDELLGVDVDGLSDEEFEVFEQILRFRGI